MIKIKHNMKKYKDCSPLETIDRVRNLLCNVGILTKESHQTNGITYSCRISIVQDNLDLLDIGTNGKGQSFEYSLASGYAEFMERLQNHVLLNCKDYATLDFVSKIPVDSAYLKRLKDEQLIFEFKYCKDEELWGIEKVISYSKDVLSKMLLLDNEEELRSYLLNDLNLKDVLMVPFYSVMDKEIKFMPIDICLFLTGSNGMSAGNSDSEALLQALCEIFERYSLRKIYYEKIIPPTISLDYFKGTLIYDKIKKIIEEDGYEIVIKDCSLGLSLPVVGLLIINKNKQFYNFKLGSDFVLSRALERCLCELQQGTDEFRWNSYKFIDVDNFEYWNIENFEKHNFYNLFTKGYGYWPSALLSENETYKFIPFDKDYGNSDEEDLKLSYRLIEKMGFKIYIRNNSILGFPAFYVIVPGMSNFGNSKSDYKLYGDSIKFVNMINKLSNISNEEVDSISRALDENYSLIKFHSYDYTSKYFYNVDFDIRNLNVELLLFMLFYKLKKYAKAFEYISIFLKDKDRSVFKYYFVCRDYVKFKYLKGKTDSETRNLLNLLYGKLIAEEIIEDLNTENILHYYEFPNCFHCDSCLVKSSCRLFSVLKIQKRIHEIASNNIIKQKIDLFV